MTHPVDLHPDGEQHEDAAPLADDHGDGRRWTPALLIVLVAILVMRLAWDGSYRVLVRSGMRPWLVVSAAVLIGLAAGVAVTLGRTRDGEDHPTVDHDLGNDHAHDHDHSLRPAVYLVVPVLLALLVAPQPLGSFAAGRSNVVPSPTSPFPALDETNGPAVLSLIEFNQRALDRDGATLLDRPVQLTGFVMAGGPLRIARFRVACCAADGQAAMVELAGVEGDPPAADQWVTVTGTYSGRDDSYPVLTVTSFSPIAPPADPYEAG